MCQLLRFLFAAEIEQSGKEQHKCDNADPVSYCSEAVSINAGNIDIQIEYSDNGKNDTDNTFTGNHTCRIKHTGFHTVAFLLFIVIFSLFFHKPFNKTAHKDRSTQMDRKIQSDSEGQYRNTKNLNGNGNIYP